MPRETVKKKTEEHELCADAREGDTLFLLNKRVKVLNPKNKKKKKGKSHRSRQGDGKKNSDRMEQLGPGRPKTLQVQTNREKFVEKTGWKW